MASSDYIPKKEGDLLPWLENFIAIGSANLATLGLTTTIMTNLTTLKSTFGTDLNAAEAKQLESKAAVETKNTSKINVVDEIRVNVKQIQAKPGVPDALKAQLGINVPGGQPAPQHPLPPDNLVANADVNGTNTLTWGRNGNPQNTIFIVDYRHDVSNPWQYAGTTTKTIFEHLNQVPGYALYYHVKAQRNDKISVASNEAVVYADGQVPPAP